MSYTGIMGYGQAADIIGEQAPTVHREGVESEFGPAPSSRASVNGGGLSGTAIALGVIAVGAVALLYFRGKG